MPAAGDVAPRWARYGACLLLVWALAMTISMAHAEALLLTDLPDHSLGTQTSYLAEAGPPLSLAQAQALQHEGRFLPGKQTILNFRIGARPTWLHLEIFNPSDRVQTMHLVAGVTWIDKMDVYVLHSGHLDAQWQTGDERAGAPGLTPALGYALPLAFASGTNEVYLRAESMDPMVLPVELVSEDEFNKRQRVMGYVYGFVYGFLLALCAYNLLLFAGLGERSYLYYSFYLLSFILANLAYTGHGLAWIWPGHFLLQRYVILVGMVLLGCCGLLFASRFLALEKHAPHTQRLVRGFIGAGAAAMVLCMIAGSHLGAALVAFSFVSLFTVFMFVLGLLSISQGREAGRYFLAATICGLLGAFSTALAVWGWLPFMTETYHAVELGIVLEATLLALALAHQMRHYQQASLSAEQLARLDPLTNLHNRRAFVASVAPIWSTAVRGNRPISLLMIDMDHFKQINDQHGHDAGDHALVRVARLLTEQCRAGDIVARWGGEEFIMFMPETDGAQAVAVAERIRQKVSEIRLHVRQGSVQLTASFGVAQRAGQDDLEDLIRVADMQLYEAKRQGRNRVSSSNVG